MTSCAVFSSPRTASTIAPPHAAVVDRRNEGGGLVSNRAHLLRERQPRQGADAAGVPVIVGTRCGNSHRFGRLGMRYDRPSGEVETG